MSPDNKLLLHMPKEELKTLLAALTCSSCWNISYKTNEPDFAHFQS